MYSMKTNPTLTFVAAIVLAINAFADSALDQAKLILSQMTLEEKTLLCAGSGSMTLSAIPRVGITNEWYFSDNSQTVRADMERWTWDCISTHDEATVLPNLSALASTWNTQLAEQFGHVMGEQARARGKDMMLGPGVNIMRTPLCGRNWEYFSEDPVLTAKLVVPEIKAMQSHDVAACVKHYCVNNQEWNRYTVDTILDDRALNEIYLPAFRAAIKDADVYSLMTSYNVYNGIHTSEHPYLLRGILRERWGFQGWIVTDWGGQQSTIASALSGAGTECNRGADIRYLYNPKEGKYPLAEAVKAQKVPESYVDEKALRVLYTMVRTNFLNPEKRKPGERLTAKHQRQAREIAEEAVTLLKNDQATLPLNPKAMKRILVVGKLADTEMTKKGWSAEGKPLYEITPYKGLVEYFKGTNVKIEKLPLVASDGADAVHPVIESSIGTFDTTARDAGMSVRAWEVSWYNNQKECTGTPFKTGFARQPGFAETEKAPLEGLNPQNFSVRYFTKLLAPETGDYAFAVKMDHRGGAQIVVNGKVIAGGTELGRIQGQATLKAGTVYDFEVRYSGDTGKHKMEFGWQLPSERGTLEDLRREAAKADAVLVFTGTEVGHGQALECEGGDRPNLKLPDGHDKAISEILAWKLPQVVVINHSGSPLEFPWVNACPTLVQQPYLGQEAGRALARVLFGDVNPSGKLPCTWPVTLEKSAVKHGGGTYNGTHVFYEEGFYIGYRWHDKNNVAPMFPFGYGLSYTTFQYSPVRVKRVADGFRLSVTVKNTGKVAGKETVQFYASYPDAKEERVIKDLKGFAKTRLLKPGEEEVVSAVVTVRDLAYWDVFESRFVTPKGRYILQAAPHSGKMDSAVTVTVDEKAVFVD